MPSPARPDALKQVIAVLVAIAALALFQGGASHVGRWPTLNIVLIAIVSLSFTAWTTTVLMPKGFLRIAPGIPAVAGMRGVVAGAFFAAEIYVHLALQEIRGVSVALSGGVLTAATITWFACSWLQGSHRLKLSREQILVIGVLMTTLGIALIPIAVFVPN